MRKTFATIFIVLLMIPSVFSGNDKPVVLLGNAIFGGIDTEQLDTGYEIILRHFPDFTSYQQTWVFEHSLINYKPQLAILNGGQEDFLLEIPEDRVVDNYLFAANTLLEENITPVLTSCLYVSEHPVKNKNIAEFNTELKEECAAKGILFLDLNAWFADGSTLYHAFTDDGYNLNKKGYEMLHNVISSFLMGEPFPEYPFISETSKEQPFTYDYKNHAMARIKRIISESPQEVSICMLGNSITEQGGNWSERLGITGIRNSGQGGYTTGQMMWFMDTTVLDANPETCFVMGGINDLSIGVPPEAVIKNLKKILTTLKENDITPVLQSTFYQRNNPERNQTITMINQTMKEWCEENGVRFLDVNSVLSKEENLIREYTNDGTHLTEEGYRVWADFLKREYFE